MSIRLTFYPQFNDHESINDHFYKSLWYLSPFRDEIKEIVFPRSANSLIPAEVPQYLGGDLALLTKKLPNKLKTITSDTELADCVASSDGVLLWSAEYPPMDGFPGKQIIKIDHRKFWSSGSHYLLIHERFPQFRKEYLVKSRAIFKSIARRCSNKIGYIFGAGQGLSLALEKGYDFSDGTCIACDSLVGDYELLDKINPSLLIVGDTAFHAGPSSQASTFRKDLIRAMDYYDADLIVPMRDYHIYLTHFPDRFLDRIAAIPYKAGELPNLDLMRDFHVSTTENILTLFLLPLAATLFDDIRLFGCDRPPAKARAHVRSYDNAFQQSDQMDGIRRAHPAFLASDYDDYYITHCETLDVWLDAIEKQGKQITMYTPSCTADLARQFAGPVLRVGYSQDHVKNIKKPVTKLVSLDPDALNHFGHFLSYERHMAKVAREKGIDFLVLGNTSFDLTCLSRDTYKLSLVFSKHSWAIGKRKGGASQADLDKFRKELKEALDTTIEEGVSGRIAIYMYCGSLEHAEIISEVIEQRPNFLAIVNLFWAYAHDESASVLKSHWKGFLESAVGSHRLFLTVPTAGLQAGFEKHFGVQLPVAPHPSATFSDDEVDKLVKLPPRASPKNPVVLFPGGMRLEKGFPLTVKVVRELSRRTNVKCIIRGLITHDTSPAMKKAVNALTDTNVVIESSQLDDNDFADFLKKGDVIVCPYQPPDFSRRTSGLVIDAMLLGCPVVSLENTWLGEFITETGIGVASVPSPEGIMESISQILKNYEYYAANAAKARTKYRTKNSWTHLVDSVLSPRPISVVPTSHANNSIKNQYEFVRGDHLYVA